MSEDLKIDIIFRVGMLCGAAAVGIGVTVAHWLCPFPSPKQKKHEPAKPWPSTDECRRQALLMASMSDDDWKLAIKECHRKAQQEDTDE